MFKNMGIRAKLIIVGALLIAVPLCIVAYITSTRASAALISVEQEQYGARSRLLAKVLDSVFQEEAKVAQERAGDDRTIAAAEGVEAKGVKASKEEIQTLTDDFTRFMSSDGVSSFYQAALCTGLDGVVFAASDPQYLGVSLADRDYVQQALSGKVNGGTAAFNKVTGKPFTAVAAPVRSGDKVVGVYALIIDVGFIQKIVAEEKIGERGFAFVIDKDGMILAHPNADLIYKDKLSRDDGAAPLQARMLAGESGTMEASLGGVTTTAGFAPVASAKWSVAVTEPVVDSVAEANGMVRLIVLITVAALVAAFLIYFLFSQTITAPLRKAVAFAALVAQGDFSGKLSIRQRDEVGKLADALNGMSARLSGMVATIQESAEQVAASSEQMSASAQSLSEGSQTQASTLEETSAAVEELSSSVDQVAEHAQSQAAAVEQGASSMTQVQKSMADISRSMAEISALAAKSVDNALQGGKAVSEVVGGIGRIAESSEKIAGIVGVISDIADQTNLLALNASIEAARAGEHGRGFAVVADEVSKLADRSSTSTKEIEALIREGRKHVESGVETAKGSQSAMEQIQGASQKVRDMVTDLSASMEQQVAAVKELGKTLETVNEMSQSISAATEEQTTNARQVSKAVENVNEITQGAASAAEQMSASTHQLSEMAQQLRDLMSQFKISAGAGGNGGGKAAPEAQSPRAQEAAATAAARAGGNGGDSGAAHVAAAHQSAASAAAHQSAASAAAHQSAASAAAHQSAASAAAQ